MNNQWMLQGSYLVGGANQLSRTPSLAPVGSNMSANSEHHQVGNVLFSWNRQQSTDSKWRVQAYYDYFKRRLRGVDNIVHTLDFEIQNQIKVFENHELVWGFGYRGVMDKLESTQVAAFDPKNRYTRTFNAFIQDEIQLTESVRFTLGSKIEHNSYTGLEFHPNARVQ